MDVCVEYTTFVDCHYLNCQIYLISSKYNIITSLHHSHVMVVLCRSARLPANLIQAQRDYFGAHTYELLSDPGKFVHTNWTGHGGNVSASSYNA